VFATRSAALLAQASDGFDHSVIFDASKFNDPRIFQQGLSSREAQDMDKARAVKPRINIQWLWWFGIAAWLLALVEVILRKAAPSLSMDFLWQTTVEHIDREIARSRVDYRAGSVFALRLGYLGSVV